MRNGFILSEWLIALTLITGMSACVPVIGRYIENLQWQQFEQTIQQIQHHGLIHERIHPRKNYLWITDNVVQLNDGLPSYLPNGWRVVQPTRLLISKLTPQATTILLTNGREKKKLTFQVGGGTFDVQ